MPVTAEGEMMKLDIEITEAEIKAAIERKIRVAIAALAVNSAGYRAETELGETS